MNSNRYIDSLITSNRIWAIDKSYAFQEISRYLAQIDARDMGATFSELGIRERKQAMLPKFVSIQNGIFQKTTQSQENEIIPNISRDSFAEIYVSGVMRADGDMCSYGMNDVAEWIHEFDNTPRIKGTLIRFSSGGGESEAGDILKSAIHDTRKPVVVHANLLGSAAYKAALPSQEIIAASLASEIGSIGVYTSISKTVAQWYRDNVEDIYASQSENKNDIWRAFLAGDNSLLQESLDEHAAIFQEEVKKYRPSVADNEMAMKGKLFTAQKAKDIHLIDAIGSLNFAYQRLDFWSKNF